MKLMTKKLSEKFKKHPLYSTDGKGNPFDRKCLVKYFNPCGAGTWYIIEASPENDDYIMFGYCDLGMGPECSEWGYVSLKELESIRLPNGLTIERDIYDKGTVRELIERDNLEYNDCFESECDDEE